MTKTYGPWIDAKMAVPARNVSEVEVEYEDGSTEIGAPSYYKMFDGTVSVVRWRTVQECKPDKHGWFKRGEGDPGAFERVNARFDDRTIGIFDGSNVDRLAIEGMTHWAPINPPEDVE